MTRHSDMWSAPSLFSSEPSTAIAETITWVRHPARYPRVFFRGASNAERLGTLHELAAKALVHWRYTQHLAELARWTVAWAVDASGLTEEEIWHRVRAEYDRAHSKHAGMTPYHPDMSDDARAAILSEEVGEVARALTPDADTPTGHGGNLVDELVQTATMAVAWLARALADRPKPTEDGDPRNYWQALRTLLLDHTRTLLEIYSGGVWEYYPEISEQAADQLAAELAIWPRREPPAEVEWAMRQLAPHPPTTDPEEN
ncbi:hypothetical protein [Actinomyces qiguomingii]|uniref:hypothetical protein n=1 Tax=Actinomyces qiguomingii TaxID=2057800 RepID=UPI000FFEBCC2|nr:hypothetical protein [Actinomyces qiguomingii]